MGQITSLFVHKVVRQVDPALDRRALLESVGVDPDAPVDRKVMVADTDYYAFLERIAREDPNAIDLPLRVGATMETNDYGTFGLAWKAAVNLRGSCERAERYGRLLTSVSTYEVREAEAGAFMVLNRAGERRLGLRLSNEASIASIASICDEVSTSAFRALEIHFRHDAPGSAAAHERHFGCPVHFGSDRDALLISDEALQAPNVIGDHGVSQFLDRHLEEEVARFGHDAALERRVRNAIAQSLSEGVPAVSDIAGQFGMSARTLQRNLSERGHSFQALVDASRRELAERLLRDTGYPLAEIAFLTGFSEQSAFTRAFKRWAGQTPRSYRLAVQSAAG